MVYGWKGSRAHCGNFIGCGFRGPGLFFDAALFVALRRFEFLLIPRLLMPEVSILTIITQASYELAHAAITAADDADRFRRISYLTPIPHLSCGGSWCPGSLWSSAAIVPFMTKSSSVNCIADQEARPPAQPQSRPEPRPENQAPVHAAPPRPEQKSNAEPAPHPDPHGQAPPQNDRKPEEKEKPKPEPQ